MDRRISRALFSIAPPGHRNPLLDAVRMGGIVLVRGSGASLGDFLEMALHLGHPVTHPFLPPGPAAGAARMERPADKVGSFIYGGAWHQNLAFLAQPPDVTSLFAEKIAGTENFTAFIDLAEVGGWLSSELRAVLATATGVHSSVAEHSPIHFPSIIGGSNPATIVENSHPCWVDDTATDVQWPFVSSNYLVSLEGWNDFEALPLVQSINTFAVHDEFVIRHYWEPGDILLWDNLRYMHRATVTHSDGPRSIVRVDAVTDWNRLVPAIRSQ